MQQLIEAVVFLPLWWLVGWMMGWSCLTAYEKLRPNGADKVAVRRAIRTMALRVGWYVACLWLFYCVASALWL